MNSVIFLEHFSPCMECTSRLIGCHAKCSQYKEWLKIKHEYENNKSKGLRESRAYEKSVRSISKSARKQIEGEQ